MISILSLNTSLDRILVVPQLIPNTVHRVTDEQWIGGGKALNVLTALQTLECVASAFVMVGGTTGITIRSLLQERGVDRDCTFFHIEDFSRICDVIVQPEAGKATVINSQGPKVSARELDKLDGSFRNELAQQTPEYLVLTGSLPRNVPESFYAALIAYAHQLHIKTVVDATDLPLAKALRERPWLVKVNFAEFMSVAPMMANEWNVPLSDTDVWYRAISSVCMGLVKRGTNVVITNGPKGAAAWTADGNWVAQAIEVDVKNAIGSGDAFLAGFLAGYMKENHFRPALAWGEGAASSNAAQILPQVGSLESIVELAQRAHIEDLLVGNL